MASRGWPPSTPVIITANRGTADQPLVHEREQRGPGQQPRHQREAEGGQGHVRLDAELGQLDVRELAVPARQAVIDGLDDGHRQLGLFPGGGAAYRPLSGKEAW